MDDRYIDVPDSRAPNEILATDPVYAVLGHSLTNPVVLGIICAFLAIVMIIAGPSTDSRFIYTDF
ncbi:MAG TPA: hypothetical protein VII69_13930 [Candidatus Eremiobacteraceae bacterium]